MKAMMERASHNYSVLLIGVFSLWLGVFPAYLHYSILDNLDINFRTSLENSDQENTTPALEAKEPIILPTFSVAEILISHLPLLALPHLAYELPRSLNFETPILRC